MRKSIVLLGARSLRTRSATSRTSLPSCYASSPAFSNQNYLNPSRSWSSRPLPAPFRAYSTDGSTPPAVSSDKPVPKEVKASEHAALSKTPLYDLHLKNGAKMVPFAGFEMPLTYRWGGQLAEHHQVRKQAGIFDVSHMVQSSISGPGATDFLTHLLPTSLKSLLATAEQETVFKGSKGVRGPYKSSLSLLLNREGGIIDDLVVTRHGDDSYYVVTNAGRRKEDLEHISRELKIFNQKNGTSVKHEVIDAGLIALQGPSAAEALQAHLPDVDLSKLYFGQSLITSLSNIEVHIARGGYTGEDGFEISMPSDNSIELTELLLKNSQVQLVGLAARDSLRLEAGMCLYGHDLSEDVGAVEAGLTWVIGEDRRTGPPFIGSEATLNAMAAKTPKTKRVGLLVDPGLVAREGTPLYLPGSPPSTSKDGNEGTIGRITSGIPSPTLKQNIAMAYVDFGKHKINTELEIRLRGKNRKATVTKMPFVKPNYWRAPASKK